MNIVVCAKIVPLASVTIQIDPATKRIIRTGVSQELDPQAAKAVEEALRLADRHGGSVTLVVMGGEDATVGIRSALAIGAGRLRCARHVESAGGGDQEDAVRPRAVRDGVE